MVALTTEIGHDVRQEVVMSTNDPQSNSPTPGESVPPPPPPPPPAAAPPSYSPPPAQGQGLGQSLAQPTVEGFPPARQQDETIWALLAHLSIIVSLGLIGPLIIMLVAGQDRPFARAHAVEALNFHITVAIGVVISLVLIIVIVGIFTLIAIAIAAVVFAILAAIKASQGEGYRYPLTLRFVK